jgi:hypothetical protein
MDHWLTTILPKKETVEGTKHGGWIYRAWLYNRLAEVWTFATDGKVAVYLRGVHVGAEDSTMGPIENYAHQFFDPKGSCVAVLNAADLQAWCGAWQKDQPCPSCEGTSKGNEYLVCTFCEGDGTMSADVRPGYLCGVPLDRNRMAQVIGNVGGEVEVWANYKPLAKNSKPDDNPIWLIGEGWRMVQMPMIVTTDRDIDWTKAPWLGPLRDELMGQYRAMVANVASATYLSDWCDDQGWTAMAEEWKRRYQDKAKKQKKAKV